MPLTITLIIYFACLLFVGFIAYKKTRSHADYVLGGRGLNGIITAFGVGASDMSGWLMLGVPGAAYVLGLGAAWMSIGILCGAYVNWRLVALRLRVFTEALGDALTIPSYLGQRFGGKQQILRFITAIIVVFFFTYYTAAGLASTATTFGVAFNMNYDVALLLITPVVVIYTALGGFLAVNWVDLFQGSLMLLALLLVPIITGLALFAPETAAVATSSQIAGPHYAITDLITKVDGLTIVSLLAWGLGYFGQPHILMRFMAAKSKPALVTARRVCMTWMLLSLVGAFATGMLGAIYFAAAPLNNPEAVFLSLSKALFNPWLVGVLIAAALSAFLSTIAAQLMVSASALAEDFYHLYINKSASEKQQVWVGRFTVFLVAGVAYALALSVNDTILERVSHAWAGLGASFGPVILLSLYWRKMTRQAALASMITGGLTVIIWPLISNYSDAAVWKLYELLPGFGLAILVGVVVSYLTQSRDLESCKRFDQAYAKLQ